MAESYPTNLAAVPVVSAGEKGYLVQLVSPEGDKVFPVVSANMIYDENGNGFSIPDTVNSVNNAITNANTTVTNLTNQVNTVLNNLNTTINNKFAQMNGTMDAATLGGYTRAQLISYIENNSGSGWKALKSGTASIGPYDYAVANEANNILPTIDNKYNFLKLHITNITIPSDYGNGFSLLVGSSYRFFDSDSYMFEDYTDIPTKQIANGVKDDGSTSISIGGVSKSSTGSYSTDIEIPYIRTKHNLHALIQRLGENGPTQKDVVMWVNGFGAGLGEIVGGRSVLISGYRMFTTENYDSYHGPSSGSNMTTAGFRISYTLYGKV